MNPGTILIRADAGPEIGTGHVMRCLALAQAWKDEGGNAKFLSAELPEGVSERLSREGIETVRLKALPGTDADAAETAGCAESSRAAYVVLDGYQFGAAHPKSLKFAGKKVLLVDDYGHADRYGVDFVLNQNVDASADLYSKRGRDTVLLLGPRYALLRREFSPWRSSEPRTDTKARRLLVTLGGSDPENITGKILQALAPLKIDGLEIVVLLGPGNIHRSELEKAAVAFGGALRLEMNPPNIPERMAWADVVLSGAGSTCWELCFMGRPSLLFILAENQRLIAEGLHRRAAAVSLGWGHSAEAVTILESVKSLMASKERRAAMSLAGRSLVDGDGCRRVIDVLKNGKAGAE